MAVKVTDSQYVSLLPLPPPPHSCHSILLNIKKSLLYCMLEAMILDFQPEILNFIFGRRYMDEEFILKIMHQLVSALQECHRRKDGAHVLHRDLKPANVFLDSSDNVKLGDFGLARVLQHDTSFAKTFVGTPYYMSPVSNYTVKPLSNGHLGGKREWPL